MLNKASLLVSVISLICVIYLLSISSGQPKRIGYIDSQRLIANYPPIMKLKSGLEEKNASYEKQLQDLMNEMQSEFKKYELGIAGLSNGEIDIEKKKLEAKRKDIEKRSTEIKNLARQTSMEELNLFTKEINDRIKVFGNENGYDIILTANSDGNLAYADRGMDITDDVLEALIEYNQK